MNIMTHSRSDNDEEDDQQLNSHHEGYKFFREVLHSPKFVVAPMVAQSELAWRMLARKYGAHLCFTPMYSANCMANDTTYQKQVLQDLSESLDRPLIVQFCANKADTFVKAAKLVEGHCDGVDLNLGCPQNIARKGNFGSYLQDNWDLIHEILSNCRKHVSIGVSAKIRVFPEVSKSIKYAQMLQDAGCHFLTVHGRTKEQKGDNTGLASWEQIREIKKNVHLPIIANGNIQYLEDVENCLDQTRVDGVMVAEGHLTNPAIFQGIHPAIYDIVAEYFSLVGKYPCSIAFVRAHLFRLWRHSFTIHPELQAQFGNAQTIEELEKLNEKMKDLCLDDESAGRNGLEVIHNDKRRFLPHWVCQPYVRVKKSDNDETEKPNKKEEENETIDVPLISKNQARRLRNYERKVESKKLKRKKTRELRKEKVRERKLEEGSKEPITAEDRRRNKLQREQRLQAAMADNSEAMKFCVDLSWSDNMNKKEISKLAGQLGRLYGSNRHSSQPAHIYFAGFPTTSFLWEECVRKHEGFQSYNVTMTSQPCHELFHVNQIVYLSPDAQEPLEEIEPNSVYVVGGLVDETVAKRLTLDRANEIQLITRRLPIIEYMQRSGNHRSYSTVLAINQVFDILLKFNETGCWKESLVVGVPARKGFIPNEQQS